MNKEKENKNLTDMVKQQYEERQEAALYMFFHREWKNPADAYLRPQADEKRDTQ